MNTKLEQYFATLNNSTIHPELDITVIGSIINEYANVIRQPVFNNVIRQPVFDNVINNAHLQ